MLAILRLCKSWWNDKQHAIATRQVMEGYNFAAGWLLLGQEASYLEDRLQQAAADGDYNFFDKGMRQALKDWEEHCNGK